MVEARTAVRGLVAVAAAEDADLIVVGSDRRPGDYRAYKVLGLRLLHGAPCAVAIAPEDPEFEVRRIRVGDDGSPESELALAAAYELAQRLHAAVTLYLAVMNDELWGPDGQRAHRDAGALLDAAAERAPAGVNPATVVVRGFAASALVEGCRRHRRPTRHGLPGPGPAAARDRRQHLSGCHGRDQLPRADHAPPRRRALRDGAVTARPR